MDLYFNHGVANLKGMPTYLGSLDLRAGFPKVELLAESSCPHGFTQNDLQQILGDRLLGVFDQWMMGQTQCICNGESYDYEESRYDETSCANDPHGVVSYVWDVDRFVHLVLKATEEWDKNEVS